MELGKGLADEFHVDYKEVEESFDVWMSDDKLEQPGAGSLSKSSLPGRTSVEVISGSRVLVVSCLTMTLSDRARLELVRNTHGLPVFPDELLLEIISYFNIPPPAPSPSVVAVLRGSSVPMSRFEGREALISLSETCRNLRKSLRSYIWDHIEVCSGMRVGKRRNDILEWHPSRKKKRAFSGEILRQLQVTTVMDPTLAQYVK